MTDPTVVLVSVGADSAALIDEIEKKGLRVVPCPFVEAEETIERERPLLVVLHGARGAVELSTMLEDAADPPQVAVVASRAELGTLMGLNRDIVVSLLATELTEKTVAARLEAVVRQRAKTLGLTLNLAARRMSLGPRPSLPRPPPRAEADAKAKDVVLDAPTPDLVAVGGPLATGEGPGIPPAPRMPGGTAIGMPARPDPAWPGPQNAPPRDRPAEPFVIETGSAQVPSSLLLSEVPEPEPPKPKGMPGPPPGPPPRPLRPGPGQAPVELADSLMESDPPHAESALPGVAESVGPTPTAARVIPLGAASVARFEPSELLSESGLDDSIGPELRAALPFRSVEPELPSAPLFPKTSANEGDDDDVLGRSRNLPLETDTDTLPPRLQPADLLSATDGDDEESLALPLVRQSRAPVQDFGDEFSSTMLTEVTMPAIPGSLAAEALAEARLRSEPNHLIPDPPPDSEDGDVEDDRATVTEGPGTRRNTPPEARRSSSPPEALAERARLIQAAREEKPPGRGWVGVLILLGAVGGSAAYIKWGMVPPPAPSVTKEPEPGVAPASTLAPPPPVADTAEPAPADEAPAAEPTSAEPTLAEPTTDTPDQATAEGTAASAPAPAVPSAAPAPPPPLPESHPVSTEPARPEAAPEAEATPVGAAPAVLLDNPFGTPDANMASCEQLAPGAQPTTSNPIGEASGHWTTARKLIVKGDVAGASRAMCFAVAINPQSPAVEGLARLYTLAHSSAQALIWIERAIQLAPTNRELLNLRGDAKSQLGRQEAAAADWLEAMGIGVGETKRRTNQAAEYANVARIEKGHGDFAKAEQFFRRALGFDEANLVSLSGMAEVLLARKLYDQAGTFAVRTLAVFEPVPEAYIVLGDVALAKNDPARARAAFERALAIRPDFWAAKKRLRDLPD